MASRLRLDEAAADMNKLAEVHVEHSVKLQGTALQLMEEVRAGSQLQLRHRDGSLRQVIMSLPEGVQRPRFERSTARSAEAGEANSASTQAEEA